MVINTCINRHTHTHTHISCLFEYPHIDPLERLCANSKCIYLGVVRCGGGGSGGGSKRTRSHMQSISCNIHQALPKGIHMNLMYNTCVQREREREFPTAHI